MRKTFRLALVTGASSGIGWALAELLASKGIPLILSGRNQQALEDLRVRLAQEVPVMVCVADLSQASERARLLRIIQEQAPDLLVNNAGVGLYGPIEQYPPEKQAEIVQINCTALVALTTEAVSVLKARKDRGTILNVSSVAAFESFPSMATYAASKAFVNSFSQAVDDECCSRGIRVLASCPGKVESHFSIRASGNPNYKKGFFVMSPDFAAREIWKQIENEKRIHVFDWRYRLWSSFLRRIIPRSLTRFIAKRNIK
ncbi:MAG: SDR family oxidoreductase [Waddliaceae bacterium]|nr:SDR family oxidoreductase [Waddliaceae bacterium]